MKGRERIFATLENSKRHWVALMPITMVFASKQTGTRYRDYVLDYRVLTEAQIRTAEKLGCGHVSCISDPTREAHNCGAPIQFWDDVPVWDDVPEENVQSLWKYSQEARL